ETWLLKPLEPMLLAACASTVNGPKVPCWPPVMSGNVNVKLPLESLVVTTAGLKGWPFAWNSSTVTLGMVTPMRLGVGMLVYPGAPVTSYGANYSVGVTGTVGGVMLGTSSVN